MVGPVKGFIAEFSAHIGFILHAFFRQGRVELIGAEVNFCGHIRHQFQRGL